MHSLLSRFQSIQPNQDIRLKKKKKKNNPILEHTGWVSLASNAVSGLQNILNEHRVLFQREQKLNRCPIATTRLKTHRCNAKCQ